MIDSRPSTAVPRLPVAVLLLTVVLLAGCGDDDTDDTAGSSSTSTTAPAEQDTTTTVDSTTAPPSSTSTSPSTSESTTTDQPGPGAPLPAADAVERYVDAVAGGDLPAAWELVDARSRAWLGDYEAFEALESELVEGIGAWAGAEDRRTMVNCLAEVDDVTACAVTLVGVVTQEGVSEAGSASMMAYVEGAGATVSPFEDPFGDAGFVFFDPAEGSAVEASRAVVIGIPTPLETVLVAVDERPVTTEELSGTGADGATTNHVITDPGWSDGLHAVTVVVRAGGAQAAVSAAYRVGDLAG